jgi:DNA-binding winged helix-turn-helix (wHTH) protein/tetratricopeptide (TPR) repeat protein
MSHRLQHIYEFESFRLDAAERLLLRDGEVVPLQPKVFDLLLALVEHHGRLLEKDELMKLVWPDTVVEEANLANNISILRRTLSENGQQFIETVPKRGYRFVAPVREQAAGPDIVKEASLRVTAAVGGEPMPAAIERQGAPSSQPSVWKLSRWARRRPGFAALLLILLLAGLAGAIAPWPMKRQPITPTLAIKSIAVLPVRPLHQDKNDEYLGIGLADAIITRLSSAGKIIVRPTSAISGYTDPNQDPLVAGREQRVDAVLESSLWRSGEKVRVTARLLNVKDGLPLWSYQCEELCTDVFAAQTLISERMAEALMPQLTGAEKARLAKRFTENHEANRLYLLGRYHWNRRTKEDQKKGIEYFQQAVEKDPNYALAYAGIAECYFARGGPLENPRENHRKAKAYAERALKIDETLAEAHTTLAGLKFNDDWDWPGAEKGYQRAIELNPGYATAHQRYSLFLMSMGRTEESLTEINRALDLDPASPSINTSMGWRLYWARRYDQAIEQFRKTLEMEPNRIGAHTNLGEVYLQKGMYAEAVAELSKAVEISSEDDARSRLGYAYAVSGQRSEAQRALAELQELSRRRYVNPIDFAILHTGLGEKDQAFAWLEKAYQERADKFAFLKVEPKFNLLRPDPRFDNLLRRIGLEP